MKRKILLLVMSMAFVQAGIYAQTSCTDLNGYINHKNTGQTGYYTLNAGYEEKAAQTYYYSGPGKVSSVRLFGNAPAGIEGGVALRVGIYNVDNTGRPTTLIQSTPTTWWWRNNNAGYLDVYFNGGGVPVSRNFAVEVELRNAYPWGHSFRLQYTGDGEGHGQDLASIAGTSTGGNWSSALTVFNKDGDFYLVPNMTNYITSDFQTNATCIATGAAVTFTNTSQMSKDSMFNIIGLGNLSSSHYYEWNFGDGSSVSNEVNPTHAFSTAGVYTVSLTSNLVGWNNTCSDTKTMRISVGLSASTSSIVNATCNASLNGSVSAVATGGAPNYVYSLGGEVYVPSPDFTGLGAGNYTMHIIDGLGCLSTSNFTITEPTAIQFSSTATTNASCGNADGGILVAATGGAGSFQFQLNQGTYQSSGAFSNIGAGSYSVTVKDGNNCTLKEMVAVNDAGGPRLTLYSMTNVSCNSASDGSILVLGSGGSGTLQYSDNGGTSFQNTGIFQSLAAGNYAVMVKDAVGCSQYMEVSIVQPPALALTVSSTPTSCFAGDNGQINVTSASGGTGAYTYSLNGSNYQSYPQFTGLNSGVYHVYVKDAAGCTKSATTTINQPAVLSARVVTTNTTCYSGSDGVVSINVSGGTPGYTFSIGGEDYQPNGTFDNLSAGQYTVTISDANSCTFITTATVTQPTQVEATINTTASTCGNNNGGLLAVASGGSGSGYLYAISSTVGNSTGSFSNLASGTYYVLISDGNGCGGFFAANIADANGPSITSTSHTNVSCNGGEDGTITVNNVNGGTGVLQYSINGTNWQNSSQFNFLNAGNFAVIVKDANGCTGTAFDTLTQPNPFTMSTTVTDLSCFDNNTGRVVILASGGSGVLAYSLNGGATYQASNVFTELNAGRKFAFVRDAAGCIGVTTFLINQPTKVNLSAGVLNVTCHGAANGAILLKATGGTDAYTYSLNNENYYASSVFLFLSGGTYSASAKDVHDCIATIPVTVYEPNPLIATPYINEVSCNGGDNGTIALAVNGGTAPYSFAWADNNVKQDRFNLQAGTYSVTVIDDQGCIDSSTFQVTQPATPLVVNGVVINSSTSTTSDGSVNLTVTGGDGPYSFMWSNNSNTQDISGLLPGNYTVNVKDANGCIVTGVFSVSSTTGIAQVEASSSSMTIYPNPATIKAIVEVSGHVITRVKVINLLGQIVFESEPKQTKVELQCNAFASGVYIVETESNNSVISKRLVVTR